MCLPALTDKIPILEIESIQLITSLLCVHDILVDHERCALGVACYALAYLPKFSPLAFFVTRSWNELGKRERNVPYGSEFTKQIEEIICRDVVAVVARQYWVVCEERGILLYIQWTDLRFLTNRALYQRGLSAWARERVTRATCRLTSGANLPPLLML